MLLFRFKLQTCKNVKGKGKGGIPLILKQSICKLIEIREKLGACRIRTISSPSQKILHLDYIFRGYPHLK